MNYWTPPLTGDGIGTQAAASVPNGQQCPTVACRTGEGLAAVRTLGQFLGGWDGPSGGAIPSIPRGKSLQIRRQRSKEYAVPCVWLGDPVQDPGRPRFDGNSE